MHPKRVGRGLILWAHGTVFPNEPITISHIYLPGIELSLPDIAGRLGYAFAASSYSKNGYAMETYSDTFDGGLALCGPLRIYYRAVPEGADFRVVLDYFFPEVLPGDAMNVPEDAWRYWKTPGPGPSQGYCCDILDAIEGRPWRAGQLFNVTKVCTDQENPDSKPDSATLQLSCSIHATNDMLDTLGGNPYDNQSTWYQGSRCDWCLNLGVDRFAADPEAVDEIRRFDSTGDIEVPLVTLHTTCDPLVSFRHELIYWHLAQSQGNTDKLLVLPIQRHGHCTFEVRELLLAFAALVYQVEGRLPPLSRFESVDPNNLPEWVTTFEPQMDFQAWGP